MISEILRVVRLRDKRLTDALEVIAENPGGPSHTWAIDALKPSTS